MYIHRWMSSICLLARSRLYHSLELRTVPDCWFPWNETLPRRRPDQACCSLPFRGFSGIDVAVTEALRASLALLVRIFKPEGSIPIRSPSPYPLSLRVTRDTEASERERNIGLYRFWRFQFTLRFRSRQPR